MNKKYKNALVFLAGVIIGYFITQIGFFLYETIKMPVCWENEIRYFIQSLFGKC